MILMFALSSAVMREYLSANGKGQGAVKTCRKYRLATTPYLRFMKQNADAVGGYVLLFSLAA